MLLRSVVRGVLPLGGTFVRPTGVNAGRTAVRLAQNNIRPLSFQRWVQQFQHYIILYPAKTENSICVHSAVHFI